VNRPPRFAIDSPPGSDGIARVTGAEAHHLRDVARLRCGDGVVLIDEQGARYEGTIADIDRAGVTVKVAAAEPAPARLQLIIAPAIIKGPRMDFIVEKAVELGATELWPIVSERTLVRAPGAERAARWRRLALAAAKQSLALPAMTVRAARKFDDLIRAVPRDTLAVICTEGAEPLGAVLEHAAARRAMLIACGPEGDFTPAEQAAAAQAGFVAAALGPHRLRSETAALAALAIAAQWRMRRG
jgi:16S rRNA (uracil1498-N3)-methyltransferase